MKLDEKPRYLSAGSKYHCLNAGEHERQAVAYVSALVAKNSPRVTPELRAAMLGTDRGARIDAIRAWARSDAAAWPAPAKAVA